MKNKIEIKDIISFQKNYKDKTLNKEIENNIKNFGILKASLNKKEDYDFKFNIKTPNIKIYNQHDSHQCNIYAFLRVVKDILHQNSDLDISNLDLSANYINFFDKLEKANALYNDLIITKHLTPEIINQKVNRFIGSFGTFHFCREIVNKYGLVPTKVMPEVNEKYNDNLTIELLKSKIKCDAMSLIAKKTKKAKQNIKQELINEVYIFLCKVYGDPPIEFNFNGNIMKPIEFKNKYLNNELEDFITITSFSKEEFLNSFSYIPNIYLNNTETIISLANDSITKAIIKQLQNGISIWFSAEESTTLDYEENILDNRLYDFANLLNIKKVNKSQKLALDIINYDHAMCITGALVENNIIKQFQVDNSFGTHGKYKGHLIMTPSFLENCVLTVIINKKYIK